MLSYGLQSSSTLKRPDRDDLISLRFVRNAGARMGDERREESPAFGGRELHEPRWSNGGGGAEQREVHPQVGYFDPRQVHDKETQFPAPV